MSSGNVRAGVVFLVMVFMTPLIAQDRTDVVVMKNGDRLTCEIKSLDSGVLHVKLDYIDGTVSIDWLKVARIESSRLFIVKTETGSIYTGRLTTLDAVAAEPIKIEVAAAEEEKVEVNRSDVVTIEPTSRSIWHRFRGDVSAGATYSKGNESTQYNLNASIEYTADRWLLGANFNSTLSSSRSSSASTRNQIAIEGVRLMRWKNYFYRGSGGFLQSSEQGIDLQSTLGGGVGRYFINTNRTQISLTGGLAFQRTNYTGSSAETSQNAAAVLIDAELRMFRFKKTNLEVTATLLPSITDPGRYYFKVNENFYIKLFRNLTWNLSFYGSWDNRPPNGLAGSDYGTTTGLGWTFGNK